MNRAGWIMTLIGVALATLAACIIANHGIAEEAGETMWVLCNPESYVCIREAPKKGAAVGGYLYCGDEIETDGIVKGQWRHIIHTSTEMGEGWVHDGYLDWSEPQETQKTARIIRGKTRARGCIGGDVLRTLKKGTTVTVFAENLAWSVTSLGYIRTELLEEVRK